jgi:hypothetical protein
MKRLLATIALLALIAGCVNIPDEQLKPIELPQENAAPAPEAQEPAPVANESTTEPLPLAPLPVNKTSKPAVMPKSTVVNSSSTAPTTTQLKAGKANVPTTWTTEPLSIAEGETKIIYVSKPNP